MVTFGLFLASTVVFLGLFLKDFELLFIKLAKFSFENLQEFLIVLSLRFILLVVLLVKDVFGTFGSHRLFGFKLFKLQVDIHNISLIFRDNASIVRHRMRLCSLWDHKLGTGSGFERVDLDRLC